MKVLYGSAVFFYNFVSLCCFTFFGGRQGTRHAAFERFDNTCGGRNAPIIFQYSGLRSDGNKLWLNSTITVKEDILIDPEMVMDLDRCKNQENLDSCERIYAHKVDKYCEMLETHLPIWEPFFSAYEPEWKCPFKKGVYRGTNGMLDASAFVLFPVDSWVWKVKVQVRNPNTKRILMCLLVQAHIVVAKP